MQVSIFGLYLRLSRLSLCSGLLLLAGLLSGCAARPDIAREEDFRPVKLRLHPIFTQVHDWTNDKKADGIDVVIEFLDGYDEPTKGRGTLLFELYTYRRADPNILGERYAEPWKITLLTREEQLTHWNRTLRAYTCQLPKPAINDRREYVLLASYSPAEGTDAPGGARLMDRLILEPPADKKSEDPGVHKAGGSKRGK